MKKWIFVLVIPCLMILMSSCLYSQEITEETNSYNNDIEAQNIADNADYADTADENVSWEELMPPIIDKPITWTDRREQLTLEYAQTHYGRAISTIEPQAVVVHWTVSSNFESPYSWFCRETREDGSVQVSSQFIVDRDGTIYRLMDETKLARHAIGYNWCAIGIENVGGIRDREDLTAEQLEANINLIRYLHAKYPSIKYVFGHYQQVEARSSGLYIENVAGYYSIKADPGPKFMRGLHDALGEDGLIFFDENVRN